MGVLAWLLSLTALIGHLEAYGSYYSSMAINFALIFVMKKLIKSMGNSELASVFGLGGYSVVIGIFINLLVAMSNNGFKTGLEELDFSELNKLMDDVTK